MDGNTGGPARYFRNSQCWILYNGRVKQLDKGRGRVLKREGAAGWTHAAVHRSAGGQGGGGAGAAAGGGEQGGDGSGEGEEGRGMDGGVVAGAIPSGTVK